MERHFKTYLKEILNENADLWIMKKLSINALYEESLNESADLLIMKSLTENADSLDLAVPRETGVERYFKRDLK